MSDIKDVIRLTDQLPGTGVVMTLYSDDIELIEMFKGLAFANLPKALNWFHQCNTRTYQMFEFWTPHKTAMVTATARISNALGLPWKNELVKIYLLGTPIDIGDLVPFDPDLHTFGDFVGT